MRLSSQRFLAAASLGILALLAYFSVIKYRTPAESALIGADVQLPSYRESSLIQSTSVAQAEPSSSGAELMQLILRAQQAYRLENNTFASAIKPLDPTFDTQTYRLAIVEADDRHAIAKAIPRSKDLRSYAGGALQRGQVFTQIVCESDLPSQSIALPVLRQGTWFCGKGSHRLPTPGAGKSSMGTIVRAQQVYRLENSTFATKIGQLDARLETTDYRYSIDKADDRHMIATALPHTAEFNSYAGGAAQLGDIFEAIICESDRPSRTISFPYLQAKKWICGQGSHPVN
jgi:hypothetical protein